MAVVLARTDNRLVHGQVLEAWVPSLQVAEILVVDRELGADPLQKMVIEGLCCRGLRVRIVSPDQAATLLRGELADRRVMLLFRDLHRTLEALDAGVEFSALNLGNIHPREDSCSLTVSVYLTPEDARRLQEIRARGVACEARAVPADRSPDVGRWLEERAGC